MPFSDYTPKYTKLKPETANTLSLMFQIFLEKNYRTPWLNATKLGTLVGWLRVQCVPNLCLIWKITYNNFSKQLLKKTNSYKVHTYYRNFQTKNRLKILCIIWRLTLLIIVSVVLIPFTLRYVVYLLLLAFLYNISALCAV